MSKVVVTQRDYRLAVVTSVTITLMKSRVHTVRSEIITLIYSESVMGEL